MAEQPMVLLTGAAGHAGRGIAQELRGQYRVRGLDLVESAACDDMVIGSVCDLDACRRSMVGCDALVTSHMGRNPDAYQAPFEGLDISIRGTLNLYVAAAELGLKRVVQISSACVLPAGADGLEPPESLPRRLNPQYGNTIYALSKSVEEMVAGLYFEHHGIITTLLRPGWIVRESDGQHKYAAKETKYKPEILDPLDLGAAVLCCLRREPQAVEGLVVGQPEYLGVRRTMDILEWEPLRRFESLRRAQATATAHSVR